MKIFSLFILLTLLSACAHRPDLPYTSKQVTEKTQTECEKIFLQKDWQLLHRIQARLPNGKNETLLGLTQLYPKTHKLHCVLMTIEGLVLFEAGYDDTISIQRAVPPFDKEGFAEGLLADIGLIFFKPATTQMTAGITALGEKICRYELSDDQLEEIILLPKNQSEIRLYTCKGKLHRSVVFQPQNNLQKTAKQIELKAAGVFGYQLNLTLLEAKPLQ
jgi:hypothetical protein